MQFKDITTWTVTPDHKATPKNIYPLSEYKGWPFNSFEQQTKDHVYHCSPSLVAGEYPAADVELVWQLREETEDYWTNENVNAYKQHVDFESYANYAKGHGFLTRQYLQLKQPYKEQEVIHFDINDFAISESDLERAFCFGYLANPENNPLDNTELMRRYEVFKTEYLTPTLSRKGIAD